MKLYSVGPGEDRTQHGHFTLEWASDFYRNASWGRIRYQYRCLRRRGVSVATARIVVTDLLFAAWIICGDVGPTEGNRLSFAGPSA